MTTSNAKEIMLFIDGATIRLASASVTPMTTPPSNAPAIDPRPPMMTIVKANRVKAGAIPGVGSAMVTSRAPAAPQHASPKPNVSA